MVKRAFEVVIILETSLMSWLSLLGFFLVFGSLDSLSIFLTGIIISEMRYSDYLSKF